MTKNLASLAMGPHVELVLYMAGRKNPHNLIDLRRALEKSPQSDRLAARSPIGGRAASGTAVFDLEGAQQAILLSSTCDFRFDFD